MKVIVDTREQEALTFSHPYITETIVETLSVGDYTVRYEDGYVPPVIFERKSIEDLFGTLTKGHTRFKKELQRAKDKNIKLILIVEGTFSKVLKGIPHSTLDGLTIIRQVLTLWLKYDLVPIFCRDREEMSNFIIEYFCSMGRLKGKRQSAGRG